LIYCISSFLVFFRVWCFQSNSLGHRFTFCFLLIFIFDLITWCWFFFLKRLHDFLCFLFYRVISISSPDPWVWWVNLGGIKPFFGLYIYIYILLDSFVCLSFFFFFIIQ
jgi:hypothetical protein